MFPGTMPASKACLSSHGTISYIDCDAVSLNALLNKAGVLSSASKIKFTGADAYNTTIPLTNVTSDSKTVVAFTQTQGLRNCMPNEAAKVWVQNLTTITLI
jgi:DMSO/TMAO reductase YedYZ molybdopterin-dependent catalytic subunit